MQGRGRLRLSWRRWRVVKNMYESVLKVERTLEQREDEDGATYEKVEKNSLYPSVSQE